MKNHPATQRELSLLAEAGKPRMEDVSVLRRFKTINQVMNYAWACSGITQDTLSEQLHISKGQISKILSGKAPYPSHRFSLQKFCEVVGSMAPKQWEALDGGCELIESREAMILQLERQLQEARRAA